MKNFTNLKTFLLLCSLLSAPAMAGPLYQWVGKDGTPTYSPDPPPAGYSYTVVGDNLEPLAVQPPDTRQPATSTKVSQNTKTTQDRIPVPTPGVKPQVTKQKAPKWKPVTYANDPAIKQAPPVKSRIVVASDIGTPLVRVSPECLTFKQEKLVLESQFAQANTSDEMDEAILRLRAHQTTQKEHCN